MRRRASRLLAFTLVALAVPGCAWLRSLTRKPKVTLKSVDVVGVDFQQARLRADLEVENRVPVPVHLARVDWGVTIDGASLVSGNLAEAMEVPARGTLPVQIPFVLKFQDLYGIAQKYKDQDEAPFRLEGKLAVDTPVGPVTLPFRHDGLAPVLKIPLIDLARADLKGVNIGGADLRFRFNVKNPNKIALDIRSLDYALTLAGAKILEGAIPTGLDVPAKGAGSFDADVRISFSQAAAAAQAILNHSSTSYSLNGSFAAGTPWGAVTSPYSKSGTIKISQ